MAKFDYVGIAATADTLVDKFGAAAAVRRWTDTTSNDWDATRTFVDYPCVAAVVEYANREVDGTNILTGDRLALVSVGSLSIEPDPKDAFRWESVSLKIVEAERVAPAGINALWMLQVRR
jgi:hypothetical protein